jgi:DNA-binding MarR family transcriptional regulator
MAARRNMSSIWDLTVPGWRMLRLVADFDGGVRLATLTRRLGITRPSAHATAALLCRVEMLAWSRSTEDRRIRILTLTDYGAECLEELDGAIELLVLEMTSDFSRESFRTTTELLNRMAHRLRRCESVFRRR